MSRVTELKYSNTNTYLIEGSAGTILFDTGWAGTFQMFCKAMGECGKRVQDIDYILISHFHPDHMGIAQEIADYMVCDEHEDKASGCSKGIVVVDLQFPYVHSSDAIFAKDQKLQFSPIVDEKLKVITVKDSRKFLSGLGLQGEILHTPGHSDDSISLWLDEGILFVGDLNPLYELELHKGTEIEKSWNKLLALKPKKVYYGHAKSASLAERGRAGDT